MGTIKKALVKFAALLLEKGASSLASLHRAWGAEPTEVSRRLTQITAIPLTMYYRQLDFVSVMSFKYSQK